MSSDAEKKGELRSRLWSGSGKNDAAAKWPPPAAGPEKPQADAKVLPLARPAGNHDRTYTAFEVRDKSPDRLHIHCAAQPSRFPGYNYLLDIIYDHDFQSAFTLVYSFMVVEISGQNLAPIVHAINLGVCECIHEYHKKLYDPPAKGESLIESIDITAAVKMEAKD